MSLPNSTESPSRSKPTFFALSGLVALCLWSGFARPAHPADLVVSNLGDVGAGTLRNAMLTAEANGEADTITFGVTGTISLQSTLPKLFTSVEILGPGADALNVSRDNGAPNFRIFSMGSDAIVTLADMTIANGRSEEGTAIFNTGTLLIERCTIRDHVNLTGGNGVGPVVNVRGTLDVRDSTICNNRSERSSGIHNQDGVARILNTTISGNTSTEGSGSGILSVSATRASSVDIDNCTVTDNSTVDEISAAVHNNPQFPQPSTMRIRNSIIADNPGPADVFALFGEVISEGRNLIGNNTFSVGVFPEGVPNAGLDFVGSDTSPLDPMLYPLNDNGGPTRTHALATGSIAIDGGANLGNPSTDQRGEPRIVDGDCSAGDRIDIGAFELENCRRGNVNRGAGPIQDVLFINDSIGEGSEFVVTATTGSPVTVRLDSAAAGPAQGRYVVYIWLNCPTNPTPFVAGSRNLGILVNPSPFQAPDSPQAFKCLLGNGLPGTLCQGLRTVGGAPSMTPWSATRNQGFGNAGLKLTLQGLLEDSGSANSIPFSLTNCVGLEILP